MRIPTTRAALAFPAALALLAPPLLAQEHASHGEPGSDEPIRAYATLLDARGDSVGHARLVQTPWYGVLLRLEVSGLAPGEHGLHVHETGRCEPPEFSSAGGHYAPRGHAHGVLHAHGKHAGDLLNLHVGADGTATTERLIQHATLRDGAAGTLFDDDGSSLMIHAGADDYRSQPSGAAGARVACGVVER